jgi:hypothetical protein
MASKKAGNNRPGSPIKSKTNPNASRSQYEQHENDYSAMLNDRDVVRGLTEREVEIDHLRTTVIALKEQVTVRILNIFSRISWGIPRIHNYVKLIYYRYVTTSQRM